MQQRLLALLPSLGGMLIAGLLLITSPAHAQFKVNAPADMRFGSGGDAASNVGGNATPDVDGNAIHSNVPMNEISPRAFRHFRRNFRTISGENWFKSEEGYLVSFMVNACRQQAWYNSDGSFMCAVKYYSGKELDEQTAMQVHRQFPGYLIKVVMEITDDNHKTFYMVTIEDPASIKTLFVCDGKIEVRQDLVNGSQMATED